MNNETFGRICIGLTILVGLVVTACIPLTPETPTQFTMPSVSPTGTRLSSPLPNLPLSLGDTWVYSSLVYDTDVLGTPGTDNRPTAPITATEIVTMSVIQTQILNGYYAAQIFSSMKVITSSVKPGAATELGADHYSVGRSKRETYWYVISGTKVYRQDNLDISKVESSC